MDVKAAMGSAMDASMIGQAEGLERRGAEVRDIAKIKKLATEFEAMFMEQMLKGMRSGVQKSGLIDGGNAEEIYTGMLDSEYAKTMASQRNTGIADMVERQLLEKMGVKSDLSAKNKKITGIQMYEKASLPALQEASKPVTMDSMGLPKIKAAR